ncbi:MAG TPA: hypothetical protein VID72_03270, partial [Ktedonobacterales bacterium]
YGAASQSVGGIPPGCVGVPMRFGRCFIAALASILQTPEGSTPAPDTFSIGVSVRRLAYGENGWRLKPFYKIVGTADRRLARERAAKGLPPVGREACLRRLQRQRARLFWEAAKAALAA